MIKISLVIPIWGNLHLLKRSITTYVNQDFPHSEYELIFVDDNSPDNPEEFVRDFMKDKDVDYTFIKFVHSHGWRGCTASFNAGFGIARGEVIAETTAESMLQPNIVRMMYEPHVENKRCFVSFKTYNLRPESQADIDTVDWRSDLYNIKNIPEFNNPHTLHNESITDFVTHQTCSIRAEVFREIMPQGRYPLYCDYGSEDPKYSGLRTKFGVQGITIQQPMPIHQWHPAINWHFAHDTHAPHLNKFAHTTSNFMQDTSGEIPEKGTSGIWDGGSTEKQTEEDKKWWRDVFDKWVKKTGGYFYED